MSSIVTRAVMGLALALTTASVAGAGAISVLEVRVPFPFVVEGQTLPAGEYRLQRDGNSSSVLLIRELRGTGHAAFVQATPLQNAAAPASEPALIFVPGEKAHQLAAVWSGSRGYATARGLTPSVETTIVFGKPVS
jgi:hypothetical protein